MYLKQIHVKKVPKIGYFKEKLFYPICTKIKFYFAMAGNTNELGPYQN